MEQLFALSPAALAGVMLIAAAGGFMRGFSGFGANLVMAPLFTLIFPPVEAVLIALLLDFAATVPLVPGGVRNMTTREVLPLSIGAVIMVPFGGLMLVLVDPVFMRLIIALTVIIFAFAMLSGRTYDGKRTIVAGASVGLVSGLLTGSTSMGGPPVVLYLLSGENAARGTRAGLHVYSIIVEAVAIFGFLIAAVMTGRIMLTAAAMLPVMLAGTWFGTRIFWKTTDRAFRLAALWFLVGVGVMVLLLSL